MILAALLSEIQNVDIRIDETQQAIRQLEAQLADSSAVSQAQTLAASLDKDAAALRARLRALELEDAGLDEKIKQVDERLYSGRIVNPKELAGLEKDEQMLKRRRSELEDEILELMDQLQRAEQDANQARAALEAAVQKHEQDTTRARSTLETLNATYSELVIKRESLRARVDPAVLELYDALRRSKKGRAVSPLKGSACSACGYAVPSSLVSRARLGRDLVQCVNCERILVT